MCTLQITECLLSTKHTQALNCCNNSHNITKHCENNGQNIPQSTQFIKKI